MTLKKVQTEYVVTAYDDDIRIVVNEESAPYTSGQGKQIKVSYFAERWRTKADAIKFYTAIVEQLKSFNS